MKGKGSIRALLCDIAGVVALFALLWLGLWLTP
jgi:hypothetical protein